MESKLCLHCSRLVGEQVYLPLIAFSKNKSSPDGHQRLCRISRSEIRSKKTNPERLPDGEHPQRVATPVNAPKLDIYAKRPWGYYTPKKRPKPVVSSDWSFLYAKPNV